MWDVKDAEQSAHVLGVASAGTSWRLRGARGFFSLFSPAAAGDEADLGALSFLGLAWSKHVLHWVCSGLRDVKAAEQSVHFFSSRATLGRAASKHALHSV